MRVTIFGSGYVGLTQAACLAEVGHQVCCVDIDAQRIAQLSKGLSPIYEPGLEKLLAANIAAGRLSFTTSTEQAIDFSNTLIIAVGTPPSADGSADLSGVFAVTDAIAEYASEAKVVINKSTSPVGTVQRIKQRLQHMLELRGARLDMRVVSNPEFLKEGCAVEDCMWPERIIIGIDDEQDIELFRELYKSFSRNHEILIVMDSRSAELTKYAANCMLATKISFINEMANLAERLGADIEMVRQGIGSDSRIGHHFIYAGCGYGGSCIPKDIKALQRIAQGVGYQPQLLEAVEAVNQRQRERVFERILEHYDGALAGKTFALWGLSFKPNTDDMREAPSLALLERLWAAGAKVQAFDPKATQEARRLYGNRPDLLLAHSKEAVLEGADALVILTEWLNFRIVDFNQIRQSLSDRVIFDGRNLFEPAHVTRAGLAYYSIGRQVAGTDLQ
jgi:UDPglucose 6-dehydrogenase